MRSMKSFDAWKYLLEMLDLNLRSVTFSLAVNSQFYHDSQVCEISVLDLVLLKWSNANVNYCLTGENLNMNASSRLVGYIGDCCQYPKFKLNEVTSGKFKIFDENKKTCLASSQYSSDAIFIDAGMPLVDYAFLKINYDKVKERKY